MTFIPSKLLQWLRAANDWWCYQLIKVFESLCDFSQVYRFVEWFSEEGSRILSDEFEVTVSLHMQPLISPNNIKWIWNGLLSIKLYDKLFFFVTNSIPSSSVCHFHSYPICFAWVLGRFYNFVFMDAKNCINWHWFHAPMSLFKIIKRSFIERLDGYERELLRLEVNYKPSVLYTAGNETL